MLKGTMSRRQFVKATGLAALGGLAGACGPAQVAPAGAPTAAPAAASGPIEGGELFAAFDSIYEDFNPMRLYGGVRVDTSKRIFSTLVQYDDQFSIVSDLAQDWELSPDGKTYTFRLFDNVKWHDGAPLTADDIVFTMNLQAHAESSGIYQTYFEPVTGGADYTAGTAEEISGIRKIDDFTVEFALDNPFAAFLANFTKLFILPQHILGDVAPAQILRHPFMVEEPIGTGPYRLTQYHIERGFEYERHDDYHFGRPLIEKMFWDVIPDRDSILLALEKGEIDYSNAIRWTPENLARINDHPELFIVESPQPRSGGLLLSHLTPGWGDVSVRQAAAHAIDRNALVELGGGLTVLQEDIFIVPWAQHPTRNWSDMYPYDPEKAKELLADAGWDPETSLRWLIRGEPEDGQLVMQEMLGAVGLKVEFELVDTANLIRSLYTDRDMGIYNGGVAYEDPYYVAVRFMCDEIRDGGLSWSGYCDEEYDALMEQEARSTTVEERAEIYHKLSEKIMDEALFIPLTFQPTRAVFNKRVHVPRYSWYVHDYSWEWWLDPA